MQFCRSILSLVAVISLLVSHMHAARAEELRVDSRAMRRSPDVSLVIENRVTAVAHQVLWPQTVRKVQDGWCWIQTNQVQGWIRQQDLLSAEQAKTAYDAEIRDTADARRCGRCCDCVPTRCAKTEIAAELWTITACRSKRIPQTWRRYWAG